MLNIIREIKDLVDDGKSRGLSTEYLRLLSKERIQSYMLSFIYSNKKYDDLIFIGGSSLRFCYDLPRLSEDLDFDSAQKIDKRQLALDIKKYFQEKIKYQNLDYMITGQFERITFKFPIVQEVGLTNQPGEKLFIKMEISEKEEVKNFQTKIIGISRFSSSFAARTFDLPILMSGKISAVLTRIYRKGKKNEIDIKGRDYYDLWWYLTKKIVPDLNFLNDEIGISDLKKVIRELDKKVNKANLGFIEADLRSLLPEVQFVKDFSKNYRDFYFDASEYLR